MQLLVLVMRVDKRTVDGDDDDAADDEDDDQQDVLMTMLARTTGMVIWAMIRSIW